MILDVGYDTGRPSARLASAYCHAHVVGAGASAGMIRNAAGTPVLRQGRSAAAVAGQLPFADAVSDLKERSP
jgi:trans-aconitate methyltransferase